MAKHKIEIEIEVANGYEPTGELRLPGIGELHQHLGISAASPFIILRKTWTPPAWLPTGRWVFRNGARWYVSSVEPVQYPHPPDGYTIRSTTGVVLDAIALAILNHDQLPLPPVDKIQITRTP